MVTQACTCLLSVGPKHAVPECDALQGRERLKAMPPGQGRAFEALGNAVKAVVFQRLATRLVVCTPTRLLSIPRTRQSTLYEEVATGI